MITALIILVIATNIGAWVFIFLMNKKVKTNATASALMNNNLAGQINTLEKTAKEWADACISEFETLDKTTIKAFVNESGELIVTSPDGTTKIDEFKITKN